MAKHRRDALPTRHAGKIGKVSASCHAAIGQYLDDTGAGQVTVRFSCHDGDERLKKARLDPIVVRVPHEKLTRGLVKDIPKVTKETQILRLAVQDEAWIFCCPPLHHVP